MSRYLSKHKWWNSFREKISQNVDIPSTGINQKYNEVVVANHCFTSLFGTNGLSSDIVIR